MKKILLTAITLILFVGASSAQIGKGHKYLGGSFNFSYDEDGTTQNYIFDTGISQYSNYKIVSFNISPEFGFFLNDKWAIGIQPGYSRVSGTETTNFASTSSAVSSYTYTNKYHTDIIGLAVNLRYYYMINDKFGIYPQMGLSTTHNADNLNNGHLSAFAGPNVVFFPSPKVGLNMGFGNLSYQYSYLTKGSYFNASLNNNFNFGVNYYFGSK
ncbi:outer membrane beta-barrel protein [Mucilaginibacter phyllosphaerae]|uniref:Outer membrane protein beta-barrel domain-containing protein n=1 Tax=Mucilaginibacter phyllosphaerae TaxID=1812349 RepID=A0A4Y8AHX1_9SPHI|nr:outer membrane beta-barrel protein [Mucilaginibacter phyllosphaerae]MBB3968338.1 hypothetical protein [Mucilaginibacter phyllosphaerae]TEW68663.1 hypothetical protein E2R65_00420 [Mucilaginibacter phyllosphaerae]GGG99621.1 hypothetical protein GCM10007352_00550 [Mucilaginibacter phyllosphaerae]